MKTSEFYIGWMQQAPAALAKFIRQNLLAVLIVVIGLAAVLALSQKKFGTGNFEFGQLTTIKGIYFDKPIPCIKVINGKDIWGNLSYITIPLVGYGKHGADGIITDWEKEKNQSLNQKEITAKGTLLYNDGKTILQIDQNDQPLTLISNDPIREDQLPQLKFLGNATIKGQIIDPKCYFGVMKPGEGKPHSDCAIRCILGGISPMLKVEDESGNRNYYILLGPDGEKINEVAQDFVAEPVSVKVKQVQYDDWIVVYLEDAHSISRLSSPGEQSGRKNISSIVACAPVYLSKH